VFLADALHRGRLHRLGPRHQMEAHLGDHAHVALAEQAIDPRPESPAVVLPALGIWQCTHAGAYDFPVGQHHLHAAVRAEVIAERRGRPAATTVERVADDAAPAWIGRIDPHIYIVLRDVIVQIEVADAGFDQGIGIALVHFEHAVHAFEVEHHAA